MPSPDTPAPARPDNAHTVTAPAGLERPQAGVTSIYCGTSVSALDYAAAKSVKGHATYSSQTKIAHMEAADDPANPSIKVRRPRSKRNKSHQDSSSGSSSETVLSHTKEAIDRLIFVPLDSAQRIPHLSTLKVSQAREQLRSECVWEVR